MYSVARKSAHILRMSLVMAAAMLATCVLALAETAHTAEAEDSLPENGKIVFTRNSRIYTVEPDGSNLSKLTNSTYVASKPVWSPDGAKIAFHAVIPDSEGGDYRKAVKKAINEGNVQKALEIGKAARDEEVYVINTDGSGRTALTNNAAADVNPHWSPDGRKITFASDRDGTFDICTMDADGSDVAQVTNARNDYLNPPDTDWQPLQEPTPPKDADDPDEAQGTKKPAVDDVDRDRPERTVIVKPGDSLWSISEQRLGPEASPQQVYDHTLQMYALNRKRIGSDPDLIFAGQRLWLPPLGEG